MNILETIRTNSYNFMSDRDKAVKVLFTGANNLNLNKQVKTDLERNGFHFDANCFLLK